MKEEIKKEKDFNSLTAMITIAIGLIYAIASYRLPKSSVGNPRSPMMFPLGLAIMLILCGIILLFKSDFNKTKEGLRELKNASDSDKKNGKLIVITCIICIVYSLIFNALGFVISTFLFLEATLIMMNGKKNLLINTIVALGFSSGIYFIFAKLLGIVLPPLPW